MASWSIGLISLLALPPGGVVTAELSTGADEVVAVELVAPVDGPLTVEARSVALDVRLSVLEEGGSKPLVEDDNGLGGTDAAATFAARAGARYRIEVRPADDTEEAKGDVAISFRAGAVPAKDPKDDDAYWERVRAEGERTGDVALRTRALAGRGQLSYARGDFAAMAADYREAVALAEPAWGASDGRTGVLRVTLGLALYTSGDYRAARAPIEAGLPAIEARYGPVDSRTAIAYNLRGVVAEDLGELREARDAYERALSIRRQLRGADDPSVVPALSNLAGLLDRLGDLPGALQSSQRALAIVEAKEPGSPRLASMLNNAAFALKRSGRVEEAIPYYRRALALRTERLGADHPGTATALQNLGAALHDVGKSDEAIALMERALAIRERRLGDRHPDVAVALGNLVGVFHDAGRDAEALPLSDRQISIRLEKLGPAHPDTVKAQVARSRVLAGLDRRPEALSVALDAETLGRAFTRRVTRFLPDAQAIAFEAQQSSGLDAALAIASSAPMSPGDVARVWESALRSRALVLDEMARRAAARRAADPASREAQLRLEAAVLAWSRLVSGASGVKGDELRPALARADAELAAAERGYAEASAPFQRELASRDPGFDDLRRAIPEGAALVSFVRHERSYSALVLPSGGKPALVPLGDARAVESSIERWRADVGRGGGGDVEAARAAEARARASGAAVRERIWDKVARAVGSASRIVVVPDGAIHLVPLGSLPTGDARYLVEERAAFQYVAAERDLLAAPVPVGGGPMLALGGPAFDGDTAAAEAAAARGAAPSCEAFRSLRFPPLPEAAREAEEVAKIVGGRSRVLTAAGASEAAFKAQAPGSSVVHLATHGFVVDERCAGEAPLQLAGLALAGANRRASRRSGEDGILMAEEIAGLDLASVGWVALSACDTGVGSVAPGEGVLGLRRAFTIAGARTLVLALWSVDDRDARKWMRSAYRSRFEERLPAAEAARAASLSLLRERRSRGLDTHPVHWGAFVVTGP